jgi:hypothetical protein
VRGKIWASGGGGGFHQQKSISGEIFFFRQGFPGLESIKKHCKAERQSVYKWTLARDLASGVFMNLPYKWTVARGFSLWCIHESPHTDPEVMP